MIKLGITGGIGSGKSIVSDIFFLCGIPVYIADTESKRLVATSGSIRKKLVKLFNDDLFENGVLNKPLLASYIFNDEEKLKEVNAIIHPEVEKDYREWLSKNNKYEIVAQETAILFESGFDKLMDKIVTVYTPLEMRIKRVMARDNVAYDNVMERIRNQMPDEKKVELSDYVIVNDGKHSLIEQVLNIIQDLKKQAGR